MSRTVDLLARRSVRRPRPATAADAEAAAEAIAVVAARPVVGATCLPRSLVTWFVLRREGIDAELVVGAAPLEEGHLAAHAWVEVDGDPVGEAVDVRQRFTSFGLEVPRLTDSAP